MFRSHRSFLSLSFVVILACSDGGGPLAADRSIAERLPVQGDIVQAGTGVFTFEGIVPLDCIGESVHDIVSAPYTFHLITTPSGNSIYVEQWDRENVTGTLVGLTTGTVWTRVNTVSPFVDRTTGGASSMTTYVARAEFVSETGPTFIGRDIFHITRDANGRVTSEFHEFRCWLKHGDGSPGR